MIFSKVSRSAKDGQSGEGILRASCGRGRFSVVCHASSIRFRGVEAMSRSWLIFLAAFLWLILAGPANAKVSADEAAQLGQSLTPFGAEKAASADGRIPAWTGGAKPADFGGKFSNFKQGDFYPELFSEDKPLLKITHDNYKKYLGELPAGAQLMLERYPEYFLNVYKTRRPAGYPEFLAKATQANAGTAHLEGSNDLKDAKLGFPFPIPKTGMEAIWNHKVRYLGSTVDQTGNFLVVSPAGEIHAASYTQSV